MAAFDDLLADQDAPRIYLVHAQPRNVSIPATTNYYFSQGSNAADYNGVQWKPRIVNALVATVGIDSGDDFFADSSTSFGSTDIAIGDGDLDELCARRWDNCDIVIYMGGTDFVWGDFEPIFTGTARDATWDLDTFHILLRDFDEKLEKNLQDTATARYLGTGDYEGSEDLKGLPKPLCYGQVKNVPAVLIDDSEEGAYLVYQVHDGPIAGIDAVYDMMHAYTSDGDVADVYAWTNVEGHYVTDLSRGIFRIGNRMQSGTVTADVRGCNSGGYVNTIGTIIQRILTTKGGMTAGDLDTSSFDTLGIWAPYTVGCFFDADTSIKDALDYLLVSGGAARYWDTTGKMHVKQIRFWESSGSLGEQDIISISRVETEPPVWERILGYQRNYSPTGEDGVAGVVTGAARTFALKEWRTSVQKDVIYKALYRPGAQSVRTDTAIYAKADADTECLRQLQLFANSPYYYHRDRYNITARRKQFQFKPLEVITVTHSRFGLSAGKDFIILGLTENTTTGTTEFRLWG